MAKTKKIQVTLEEDEYQLLAEIARRQNKKLASVVRASIERFCLSPETQRRKKRALETLSAVKNAPAPKEYGEWKRQYGILKTKSTSKKS